MIKRIFYILTVVFLAGVIAIAFYFINNQQIFDNKKDIYSLPNDAIAIIQINNIENLATLLDNKIDYNSDLMLFDSYKNLKANINLFGFIMSAERDKKLQIDKEAVLSLHAETSDKNEWLLSVAIENNQEQKEYRRFFKKYRVQDSINTSADVYCLKFDSISNLNYYGILQNGLLTLSPSEKLIKKVEGKKFDSLLENKNFIKIKNTTLNNQEASIYLNYDFLIDYLPNIIDSKDLPKLFSWAGFDLNIRKNEFFLNGFTSFDSEKTIASLFQGVSSRESTMTKSLPLSTKFFINYCFEETDKFKNNLEKYLTDRFDESQTGRNQGFDRRHKNSFLELFFSFVKNEMTLAYVKGENNEYLPFFVVETTGQSLTLKELKKWMSDNSRTENPAGLITMDKETKYPYYEMPEATVMRDYFNFILPEVPSKYFAFYENHIVFADDTKALYEFLYSNMLKKNLNSHPYFNGFVENFSFKENFFCYSEVEHIYPVLEKNLNKEKVELSTQQKEALANFYGIGIQLSTAADLLYTTIYANHTPNRDKQPQTIWQSRLDSIIVGKPSIVTNHITGENEVLIQDGKSNLYLINSVGRILWKRPLDGEILSDIYQIDFYKNNKLQYLFNTKNRLYLLDRNGNHVEKYPITLPENATNGLSVYDYDKNKDYRIFVALSDKKIYLYDKYGNRNVGWTFPKTEGYVNSPVQHFVTQGRDYIVCADNNRTYILNRKGENRVIPEKQFNKLNNSVFYLENKHAENPALITSNKDGNIVKIALPSGKTTINKDLKIEKSASIKNMVFQEYSNGNKIYVFVTDKDLYIYDEKLQLKSRKSFKNNILPNIDIYEFAASDFKLGVVEQKSGLIHLINVDGSDYKGFPLKGVSRFSIGFLKSSYRFNLITGGEQYYLYNYLIE